MSQESESKTRKQRINTKLKSLNWQIVKYRDGLDTSALQCHAVEEYLTANGPADYALFVKGRLLGVVEAKKSGWRTKCFGTSKALLAGGV